jgi:hypothetical protein
MTTQERIKKIEEAITDFINPSQGYCYRQFNYYKLVKYLAEREEIENTDKEIIRSKLK